MNCNRAAELLPWLLNGTLEAGERREVLDHLRGCPGCRAALADTRIAWETFDWHPEPAALIAYAGAAAAVPAGASASGAARAPAAAAASGGGVAAGAAAANLVALEEHLAGCPSCAAELELVRTSRMLADPAEDERIAILPARRRDAGAAHEAAARHDAAAREDQGASNAAAARGDAAAGRAWRRSALAAGLVGLLAATGWFESARQTRDLERRLAAAGAAAPAPAPRAVAPAAAPPTRDEAADLRRRAGEAEARLAALAGANHQLQGQVAELGRAAADLDRRAASAASAASQRQAPLTPAAPAAPPVESDAWVGDLNPSGQVERGAGEPAAEVIPLSSGTATVLLHARIAESSGDYEIEIRDARDRLVVNPIRVQPQPGSQGAAEEFAITLRRGALAPGAYTFRLLRLAATPGAAEPARKAVATYSVRIS